MPTYYFRTHVTWPANADPYNSSITMHVWADDGMILYINGVEAWRTTNVVSTNEGFSQYLISGGVGNPPTAPNIVPLSTSFFQPGDNVIAVYLKQSVATSSDISLVLALDASITNIDNFTNSITISPTNASLAQCATLKLQASVHINGEVFGLNYQWFHGTNALSDGGNISGANWHTLTISNVQPSDAGNYRCRVTDAVYPSASMESADVPVTVDTNPPAMLSAVGQTDLHTIIVSFDKAVAISSATGGDFLVQGLFGDYFVSLQLTNSYVTNATNVVLVSADARQATRYMVLVRGSGVTTACSGLPVRNNSTILLVSEVLIVGTTDNNNSWQYNQAGVDLGTAWLANGYDDHDVSAGWATGTALFDGKTPQPPGRIGITNGLSYELVNTHLDLTNALFPSTTAVIPSYYFRKQFNLPANACGASLSFRTFFDDYAIVYLNGQEVCRATNIVATNEAFSSYLELGLTVGTAWWTPWRPFPTTNLLQGDNVLAVYLKQGVPGSSDITMALELKAAISNYCYIDNRFFVSLLNNGDGTVDIPWWPRNSTLQYSTDLQTWTDIPTNNPYRETISGNKFFRIKHP